MNAHLMTALATFSHLPRRDRLLLAEGILFLAFSSVAIRVLPFRMVGRLAGWPGFHRTERAPQARVFEAKRIRWAIEAWARRVPWHALCFQKGLAAQLMLRRRGIESVLYYGAAPAECGLSAHVWVRDGDIDVVGGEIAPAFAVLATFPPQT